MIIIGDDFNKIAYLKFKLSCFVMNDLGLLRYFLDTLLKTNARYSPFDASPLLDLSLYCTIIDSLVYLCISHLDIAYIVHV